MTEEKHKVLKKSGEGHHVFPEGCDSGPSGHYSSDLVGAIDSTGAQQELLRLSRNHREQVSFMALAC